MSRDIMVTGSASGIGLATARAVRDRGDRVIGIDLAGADVVGDLATRSGREAAAAGALDAAGGRVHAVIACAGPR